MTIESFDVIIVGCGPAGASTALHLLQRDHGWSERMLILEKEHFPREKLCGGGITRLGGSILAALGLSIEVPHVYVREAHLQFEDLTILARGVPMFWVTHRSEFDAWLSQKASERGARLREGEPVIHIEVNTIGVTVTTNKAQYRAKVLVGADGSKGIVRKRAGLKRAKRVSVSRLLEVITPEDPAVTPEFREQFATLDFSPMMNNLQGYYWDFPSLVKGEPHMNRGVFDSRTASRRPRARLKSILAENMKARHRDLAVVELKGHPLHWIDWRGLFSRPHVLLVGDAAGADPLLGEGIAFALDYGRIAADAITDAFAREDFSFRDYRRRIMTDRLGRLLLLRWTMATVLYSKMGRWVWRLWYGALVLLHFWKFLRRQVFRKTI
ncbi:MAG: FAD-dependent monooxygenase [Anaerolineales bacterium]|nr:FAD-dependent monooxygenase [Anaerolineales bacterium]